MEALDFLYINGVIVLGLAVYMLSRRPIRRVSSIRERKHTHIFESSNLRDDRPVPITQETQTGGTRNLNVIFMYNGHNFDAFEVLGIPAGSSLDQAQKAFEKEYTAAQSDPPEQTLLKLALDTIQQSQK